MYCREYRTQFHIGVTYCLLESRVCEIINEAESILTGDSRFHLPGRKTLLKEENRFDTVLMDVMESPVEHPKKTAIKLLGHEKASRAKVPNCRRQSQRENTLHSL
jgi:hypothetical protein